MTTTELSRFATALLAAGSLTACTVDKQEAPPLMGPSGQAQSLTMTASPDRLAHNGVAQSVVTVAMRNDSGQPIAGQRIGVGASSGLVSHVDVVTDSNGMAAFVVVAPALSTPAKEIIVAATPVGTNADNALTRTLTIALTGTANTTAPTASFEVEPNEVQVGEFFAFDASATTDEGKACGSLCTYKWDFDDGDSQTGSSPVVAHKYGAPRVYVVKLTVTDGAGTFGSAQKAVRVLALPEEQEEP